MAKCQRRRVDFVNGAIEARDCHQSRETIYKALIDEYAGTVFNHTKLNTSSIDFMAGTRFLLKSNAKLVNEKMFQIQGERKAASRALTD